MAARICARGARYFHLVVDMPRDLRGREMDAETLDALGAHLDEYIVQRREDG
jgi:CRISPR-associated protein Csx16